MLSGPLTRLRPSSPDYGVPILFAHHGQDWIRGSERCLLDLIAHLDDRFSPVVICNSPALGSAAEALGAFVHCAERFRWRDAFLPERHLVAEAGRIIRQHRIGLVHANGTDIIKWLIPPVRTARIPLLAHVHLPSTATDRCLAWIHQVARVVGVSRAALQPFFDDGLAPERLTVIHNGVDPDRLGAGDATTLRADLGIGSTDVVIVAVGSLIPRKGFDILLRAFAQVHTLTKAYLLIVGTGPERAALQALAHELELDAVTRFLDERADAGAIFRDVADIAASAARQETFGLTLIESGLFGIPVAASAIEPHGEVVLDGETGLLAAPENPAAMAAVLGRLIENPPLRRRLGEAGRRRVHADFLVSRYVQRFQQTYDELLAEPPGKYGWLGEWTWPAVYTRHLRYAIKRRLGRPGTRLVPGSETS